MTFVKWVLVALGALLPSVCVGWQQSRMTCMASPCGPIRIKSITIPRHSTLYLYCKDNDGTSETDQVDNPPPTIPQSRLARLAEDWLDEEKLEDERISYWERFEEKTPNQLSHDALLPNRDESCLLTTEERLERYLDNRGIRRKEELDHQDKIETAIQLAQKATTSDDAIVALENVQPWLQVHTRLGGLALVEYLIAQWQTTGILDKKLCSVLLQSPHDVVVAKVRQLCKRSAPPPRQPSFWSGIFSKDGSGGWW